MKTKYELLAKEVLRTLRQCKKCKYYKWEIEKTEGETNIEYHYCLNNDRWQAEGYNDSDFEELEEAIYLFAYIEYAENYVIDCRFDGGCNGKFFVPRKEG